MNSLIQVLITSICVFTSGLSLAQDMPKCPEISYEDAIVKHARVPVDRLEGQAVFSLPDVPRMLGSLGGYCMALFDEVSMKRVATSWTDNKGAFAFESLAAGDYVLIGRHARDESGSLRLPVELSNKPDVSGPLRGLLIRVEMRGTQLSGRGEAIGNLGLRRTLIDMLKIDQAVRMEMIDKGMENIAPEMQDQQSKVDAQTETRLAAIVREHGWPGLDMVGLEGTAAASVMLQHIGPEMQKKSLPLVEAAFRAGNVMGPHYAGLVDRVRLSEGRLQLYGTVAKPFTRKGEVVFQPIEGEAGVDERRAEVGLMPLAEYRELMKQTYFPSKTQQPATPATTSAEEQ
ncbi:MAG: DUF6624 domain-containing protein [Pseudomonadota bacterium]